MDFPPDNINYETAWWHKIRLLQYYALGVEGIDESPYNAEIRILLHASFRGQKLFRLTQSHSNQWQAQLFSFQTKYIEFKTNLIDVPSFEEQQLTADTSISQVWEKLTQLNIYKLNDYGIDNLRMKGLGESRDGDNYQIELKYQHKYRFYEYNNPFNYAKGYPEISDLQDFVAIIQTIEKHFKIKLS